MGEGLKINVSDVKPFGSAILNKNKFAFYGIHVVAVFNAITSLISCLVVIFHILYKSNKARWDFSDRFPLYLAVADVLWGISFVTGHMALLMTQKFPEESHAFALSLHLWIFLEYQQLMHAGLSAYTYLKIVHRKSVNLGEWEWKLHLCCVIIIAVSVGIFLPLKSFGSSGYWFLQNVKTEEGKALGIFIAISTTIQGLFTALGYKSIQNIVEEQQKMNNTHFSQLPRTLNQKTNDKLNSTTDYLSTFVRIALGIYCSFAVAMWILVIESFSGFFDPITCFVVVLVASSSGWANALGYFKNKRAKGKKAEQREDSLPRTCDSSSNNLTLNTTVV